MCYETGSDATIRIRRKFQRWERSAQVLIAKPTCAKPHDVQFSFSINQRPVRARARSTRKKQFLINNNRFHDGETVISHYRFLRSRSPLAGLARSHILPSLQGVIAHFSQLVSPTPLARLPITALNTCR